MNRRLAFVIMKKRVGYLYEPCCLLFHPQGHLLVGSNDDGLLRIWDVEERHLIREIQASSFPQDALVFSHDGNFLITADAVPLISDGPPRYIRVWDFASGQPIWQFHSNASLLACDRNSELLVSAHGTTLDLWSLSYGQHISTISCAQFASGTIKSLAFHPVFPSSLYIFLQRPDSSFTVLLLDIATKSTSLQDAPTLESCTVQASVLSSRTPWGAIAMMPLPHGNSLAIAGHSSIEIWDLLNQEYQADFPLGDYTEFLHADSMGRQLISVSPSGHFSMIDLQTQHIRQYKPLPLCRKAMIFGARGLSKEDHRYLLQAGAVDLKPKNSQERETTISPISPSDTEDRLLPQYDISGSDTPSICRPG